MNKDPTNDIYQIMDNVGLTPSDLYNTKKSMAKIINDIRTGIAKQTADYILKREEIIRKEHDGTN